MRPFIGGLLVLAATSLSAADKPAVLESRTQNHSIVIEVRPEAHYMVRVIDLVTNETLFSRELVGARAEASADYGDRHVEVRIGAAPYGITTTAEIEREGMVIDSIHSVWSLTPHRARIRAENALRVGGDVKAPVVIRRVEPVYSEEARKERISGIVILEALIDKSGMVKDAVVLKGLPDGLSDSALNALKQWQFQPATLNGEPVDVIFNLTFNFKIDVPASER
jgi:TonB family protein